MLRKESLQQILLLYSDSKLKEVSVNIILQLMNDEESEKCVVAQINQWLTTAATRMLGIELLNSCMPQFSLQIISDHGIRWIRTCLSQHKNNQNREVFINTVANIVQYAQNDPVFSKKFVSEFLTQTLDAILKQDTDLYVRNASLTCLIACLANYASSCNPHKKKIEEYILKYLNTSSEELASLSGSAFFYCQQIGSSGADGLNHINNRTLTIRKLCVTAHKLFNSMFKHHLEFERFEASNIQPFDVSEAPVHFSFHQKLNYKEQILKNILNWMVIFFQKPSQKVIYPEEVLNVIRRGISLHVCLEQNDLSLDSMHFALTLIKIQTELLKLLEIFIHQMGVHLDPFYSTITKMTQDIITRNQACNCYNKAVVIQEYIYSVVSLWLKIGGNWCEKSIQDRLIVCIVKDAFPIANAVTLKVDSITKRKTKMKKLKLDPVTSRTPSEDASIHSKHAKLKLCINALKSLHTLLDYSHLTVNEKLFGQLYSSIAKTLISIQNGLISFPFNDCEYQLLLYKILGTFLEQDRVDLPPVHEIINILIIGLNHENKFISITCSNSIRNLEKLCQPMFPSLNHVLDLKKIVSVGDCSNLEMDNLLESMESTESDEVKGNQMVNILSNTVLVTEYTNGENGFTKIHNDQERDCETDNNVVTSNIIVEHDEMDVQENEETNEVASCKNHNNKDLHESNDFIIEKKIDDIKKESSLKRKYDEDDSSIDMTDFIVDDINDDCK